VYAFEHRASAVWEMSQSYQFVWGTTKYKWGGLIQLAVYAASTLVSAAFFALLPPAAVVHVQEAGGGIAGLTPKTGGMGGGGKTQGGGDGKGEEDPSEGGGGGDRWGACKEVEEELGAAGDPLLVGASTFTQLWQPAWSL
jgi:hypothetical protein